MCKYYEYNLINNIPVLHPENNNTYYFCPRQDIATPDIILNIFKNIENNNISIRNKCFKYLKINLNKKYKTFNNNVEALFCYIIYDDINLKKFNSKNIIKWLKNSNSDHNFIITCPVFIFKDTYYSISNNDNPSIINILNNNDINNINLLLESNCFTICNNYNIIISLYQKNILNKKKFIKIIKIIKKLNDYYTDTIWIYYMNTHKILNACDYPFLFLARTPHLIHKDILILFNNMTFDEIYLQTNYNNTFIFTSLLSNSYPYTTKQFLLDNGFSISNNLWTIPSLLNINYDIFDKSSIFIPDFYGFFATIVSTNSLWNYWNENYIVILNTFLKHFHYNNNYLIINILHNLFQLYNKGFEGRYIRKNRIRKIWINILNIIDLNKNILPNMCNLFIIKKYNFKNIPYIFLKNVYELYNIDIVEYKQYIINTSYSTCIYKNTSIYELLRNYKIKDNIYYFYNNIIKKKIIYILMCIYKKFKLYKNITDYDANNYNKGIILIEYFKNNIGKFI